MTLSHNKCSVSLAITIILLPPLLLYSWIISVKIVLEEYQPWFGNSTIDSLYFDQILDYVMVSVTSNSLSVCVEGGAHLSIGIRISIQNVGRNYYIFLGK